MTQGLGKCVWRLVGACQKLLQSVICVKWPVISWPLSSFLWTDVHQRIKLLTEIAPILADPVKKLRLASSLVATSLPKRCQGQS